MLVSMSECTKKCGTSRKRLRGGYGWSAVLLPPGKTDMDGEEAFRIVVPDMLREDELHAYHTEAGSGAHQDASKVYARLRKRYY